MKKSPKKTTKKVQSKKQKKSRVKKPTQIVVTSPVEPTAQIIVASELADDAIIEAELMGEILPYYIYQFCENSPRCKPEDLQAGKCTHKKTTGMSVKGVNETVRRLNRDKKSGYNIRINPNHIKIERDVEQNGEKGVAVTVYAENLLDGNSAWGAKFEPYKKNRKNGQYDNTFPVEKALSKAERNAKRKLIPETVVVKMIEKLIAENPNNVKALAPAQNVQNLVAPLPPKASEPEDIENLIRQGIQLAKKVEVVTQFDQNVHKSTQFDDKFKDEVRKLASKKIDELMKK